MTSPRSARLLVAAAFVLASQCALAAPCAGFDDVDDASAFCPNVDWLRNRAVTLGCTATAYCPDTLVSRLAMAAFMNRLGLALTPAIHYGEATGTSLDLDAAPGAVCQTTTVAAATFPRSASVDAVFSMQLGSTAATAALRVVQSVDGGATWTSLNALPSSTGGTAQWRNAAVSVGGVPLAAGVAYRFGLRVERAAGGGTGDPSTWTCQVSAFATSRTGTTFPY